MPAVNKMQVDLRRTSATVDEIVLGCPNKPCLDGDIAAGLVPKASVSRQDVVVVHPVDLSSPPLIDWKRGVLSVAIHFTDQTLWILRGEQLGSRRNAQADNLDSFTILPMVPCRAEDQAKWRCFLDAG